MNMTSGPDRSIAGLSFPKWMKSKITDRSIDFEENAFSPPSSDDGFFLVRFKKPHEEDLSQAKVTTAPKYTPVSSLFEVKKDVDLSKHTTSCKEFIPNAKITPREIGLRNGTYEGVIKSTGIDDGFKGEGAACGYSIVAVAHQMIAERNGKDELIIPKSQRMRRNSKSLPSSPLSSPKLLRKNPYFTSILFGSNEKMTSGGTALTGGSVSNSSDDLPQAIGRASSEDNTTSGHPARVLKAKPSQLREMNFWSPTSM
uniref:Unkown protein n=1 Tax=Riptortus pedestris TaxID=329032 RepID=R4WRT9_RIPPE|nr:unkown protein [Riptortus pedestris]